VVLVVFGGDGELILMEKEKRESDEDGGVLTHWIYTYRYMGIFSY